MFSKNKRVQDPLLKLRGIIKRKICNQVRKTNNQKKDNWEEWAWRPYPEEWIITLSRDVPFTPARKSFGVRY